MLFFVYICCYYDGGPCLTVLYNPAQNKQVPITIGEMECIVMSLSYANPTQ